jgi:hypothetical protein
MISSKSRFFLLRRLYLNVAALLACNKQSNERVHSFKSLSWKDGIQTCHKEHLSLIFGADDLPFTCGVSGVLPRSYIMQMLNLVSVVIFCNDDQSNWEEQYGYEYLS